MLGCCLILPALPGYAATDSIPSKIEAKESNTNDAYRNPAIFSHVPVERSGPEIDTTREQQTFKKIHSTYDGSEFNYKDDRYNRLSWWDRLSRKITDFLNSLIPQLNWNFTRIFYYALIGIGLAIFIFVVYKLTISGKKPGFSETNENDAEATNWMEKKLTKLDLQTFLEQALAEKNYMLAIRYLHLINLKKLAASGQIEWHYQKTNRDFLWELKNKALRNDFAGTIRIYEYIWYGKFDISETKFKAYRELFNQFNQKVA